MTYGHIDTEKVRELASQGLNAKKIGEMLGHSKTGIYLHCLSKNIELVNGNIRLVNVDGVKMPIGEACALKGFTRESMYQYRSHRGLDLQDGFEAYVLYMQTKQATATVRSKNIMLMFRHKLQPITTIKSILGLGEGFLMFMRNNNYKQQAFNNYLYTRGIK
jgi:hypothetical protein